MKKRSKFLAAAIVCAALAVILAVTSFAALKLGDVNGNGNIGVDDARIVLRFAVKLETPANAEIKAAADVDRSGDISVGDARNVLRAAVNLEPLPDEPAIKPTEPSKPTQCTHNFVWKQVEAVSGVAAWSNGTHIKTCTKCGVTTGLAVDCDLGDIIYNKDNNGKDILPSCSRAVNYYQECSVCGGKKQDSFKKLPHKYDTEQTDLVTVVTDPTCTTEGTISVRCTMCKSNPKDFTTRALGHDVPDTENIKEGDSIVCNRCHEALKPEAFDYDDNEFLIWASGKYYYRGRAKTLTGHNTYTGKPIYDEAEMTLAIDPGKSLYMRMPFDGSTEIGYLAYVERNKWTGKDEVKKYFESEYEGKRYYFYLDDDMINMINGDSNESMEFPSPTDTDFDTRLDVDLRNAEQSLVVYEGNICTRFTFGLKSGGELRAYLNGKKLLLVETRNSEGEVTDATYFDEITANIPSYMTTTNKNGTVLSGMVGLLQFANYIGILG